MREPKYIIVIGTSAGGLNALSELVGQLNDKMDAAFFIVMHLSKRGISNFLANKLKPLTTLECKVPNVGDPIERGQIYIAPPNAHLMVKRNEVIIGHGPEENRWRPSIDVLFRSAAAAYSGQVVGIVLTGLLTDGTSGMIAIKNSGGTCIVQDPNEAEYADMPLSVLNHIEADYCVSLADMGQVIEEILQIEPKNIEVPSHVVLEAKISAHTATSIEEVKETSEEHSLYSCPDCGGGLWKIKENGLTRYRCHVGHAYLEGELLTTIGEKLESTLWIALRMMEERVNLLIKMAQNYRRKGLSRLTAQYQTSAEDLEKHIGKLKDVLIAIEKYSEEDVDRSA